MLVIAASFLNHYTTIQMHFEENMSSNELKLHFIVVTREGII